jgi:ketosteroid isomerase-like protein
MKNLFLLLSLVVFVSGCVGSDAAKKNEQTVIRYFEAIHAGDTTSVANIIADDFIRLSGGVADQNSKSEMLSFLINLHQNSPDFHFHVDHIAASSDKAGIFWTAHSKSGEGKDIAWTGSHMLLFNKNGLIQKEYIVGDRLGMYEQLGYVLIKPHDTSTDETRVHPGVD